MCREGHNALSFLYFNLILHLNKETSAIDSLDALFYILNKKNYIAFEQILEGKELQREAFSSLSLTGCVGVPFHEFLPKLLPCLLEQLDLASQLEYSVRNCLQCNVL